MSVPPALDRLYRLGAAAADAVERWRAPTRSLEGLQGGLERYGFDGGDPLAGLLQGAGLGTGLGAALERLALPPPQSAPEPEAGPRRRVPAAFATPAQERAVSANRQGVARSNAPSRGSEPDAATVAEQDRSGPAPAKDVAGGRRNIGAEAAQECLARRAAAVGAAAAWAAQAVAPRAEGGATQGSTHLESAAASSPSGAGGAAWPAQQAADGAVCGASLGTQFGTALLAPLERALQRVDEARGGGGRRTPGISVPSRRQLGRGGAPEKAGIWPTPGVAGADAPSALPWAPSRGVGESVGSAAVAAVQSGQAAAVPAPRSRIGGLRGLAALAQGAAAAEPPTPPSLLAGGAASAVAGALQGLTLARPPSLANGLLTGGFADALAPLGAGQLQPQAPSPDPEALARELTRLLRREAERHGIDLDGVGP